jgi:S1-C subfamily serine protease
MRPVIEQLVAEGHQVRHVDVSTRPQLARQFRVTRWPTFLVLVDGVEHSRLVGIATHAQLVDMINRAGGASAPPTKRTPAMLTANQSTPSTFAAGPQVGRIVAVQDPTPKPPGARGSAPSAPAGPIAASNAAPLIAATVRLSVSDPDGHSTGTGSIVDSREGEALVLTCGHLFRASNGQGAIELSLFADGPNGAELQGNVAGVLVDFDLDRDLALVRFTTNGPVAVAPIAPPGTVMQPGMPLTSVGCNNGDNPTARATKVTDIDRYVGHPNIEAAGAPVEGRSGGGLFNAQGQLVGVCYAADPPSDEGLYASLPSIYAKLDSLGLSKVYREPAGVAGTPARPEPNPTFASAAPPVAPAAMAAEPRLQIRGQNPTAETASPFNRAPVTSPVVEPPAASPAPAAVASTPQPAAGLSPQERAILEEIQRRGVESEIVCIIRPKNGEGPSDVIKIPSASPALVEALAEIRADSPANPGSATAHRPAEAGALVR